MRNKTRVVLADDNDAVRECVRMWLVHLGYDVVAVADCNALIGPALQERPDIVISDVHMPDTDGITAVEAIRRESMVPVIFVSGDWDNTNYTRAACVTGTWCLSKPLRPLELVAVIEAARAAGGMKSPACESTSTA